MVLGIATQIDLFVQRVGIPFALTVANAVAALDSGATGTSIATIFWRSVVKGTIQGVLPFLTTSAKLAAASEIVSAFDDSIPIAGGGHPGDRDRRHFGGAR